MGHATRWTPYLLTGLLDTAECNYSLPVCLGGPRQHLPRDKHASTLPWPTRQCCWAGGADLGQGAASLLSVAQIMQQSPGSTQCAAEAFKMPLSIAEEYRFL